MSIRQLQHIRTNYLSHFEVTGRTDRMNCYIWAGAFWGAQICQDYYNMHIRPLEAELQDIGEVDLSLRDKGAPWLKETDVARGLGKKAWVKSGREASTYP